MGVSVAIVRAALRGTVGTQDFTKAGFGTPKAALFIVSNGEVDGTEANNARFSFGAADGVAQWVVLGQSNHGVTTSNTDRRGMTDKCLALIDGAGNVALEAAWDAWVTDGVRIDVTTAGDAVIVTVILFNGTDLSADVGTFLQHATENSATDVTGPGFEPDLVFVSTPRRLMNDTNQTSPGLSVGVCANDGGADPQNQGAWNYFDADGVGTTLCAAFLSSNRVLTHHSTDTLFGTTELTDFDANGFSGTTRDAAGDANLEHGYLALAFGGAVKHDVFAMDTPTSTGDQAYTDPGWTPQFVMLLKSHVATVDTLETTGPSAYTTGIGVMTAADESAVFTASEDAQGTSDTESGTDSKAVWLPPDEGGLTNDFIGTGPSGLGSFDALGFTINFSAVDTGTVRKWIGLAIEKEAVAVSNPWHVYAQQ